MKAALAHTEDCLCVPCMMADMDAHVAANGGTVYLAEQTEVEETRYRFAGQGAGRGIVRKISDKQARFILSLINTRDIKNLVIFPGQTLDPNKLTTMGLPGARALIDKLLNCPELPSKSVRMATDGQKRFIANLNSQIIDARCQISESDIASITFAEVNDVLSLLKAIIKAEKKDDAKSNYTKSDMPKADELSEGMYKCGEKIFKVYFNQAHTRLLAKELIDGSFEYQGMASRFVKPQDRMTLDEAKAYGKVTGTCCVCSRRLTKEDSIEAGIGPVCAANF